MKKRAVVAGYGGNESLRIYVEGSLAESIHIDRTHYGPEWNRNHGMSIVETVTTENGEAFDIWKRDRDLACATPRKG